MVLTNEQDASFKCPIDNSHRILRTEVIPHIITCLCKFLYGIYYIFMQYFEAYAEEFFEGPEIKEDGLRDNNKGHGTRNKEKKPRIKIDTSSADVSSDSGSTNFLPKTNDLEVDTAAEILNKTKNKNPTPAAHEEESECNIGITNDNGAVTSKEKWAKIIGQSEDVNKCKDQKFEHSKVPRRTIDTKHDITANICEGVYETKSEIARRQRKNQRSKYLDEFAASLSGETFHLGRGVRKGGLIIQHPNKENI